MSKTVSELSDEIWGIKVQEKALKEQLDDLEKRRKDIEQKLIEAAEKQGLKGGTGATSKFSVEETTLPQVADWDAFCKFLKKKGWFHLLQRRPASKACQELWEQGQVIPGIDKFTKIEAKVKEV